MCAVFGEALALPRLLASIISGRNSIFAHVIELRVSEKERGWERAREGALTWHQWHFAVFLSFCGPCAGLRALECLGLVVLWGLLPTGCVMSEGTHV